jgi:thiamine biosynthesis lipoprotein
MLLVSLAACDHIEHSTRETYVMGTYATVTVYAANRETAAEAAAAALGELHRIESVMSNWLEESEISLLNRESRGNPYKVSSELFSLIDSSLYYSNVTSGSFDITARPLVRLWGFQGGTAKLPTSDEIEAARKLVGHERIVLDRDSSSVVVPEGMSLDLAGVAKGYALDRSVELMKERGITAAVINLGGNVFALGHPPGKAGWTVGIRDPNNRNTIVGSIMLRDEAIATSGNYENYVIIDGVRYGHIIDPRTGRPAEEILSVSVVAPTALASDALATGLFVLGPGDGRTIIDDMEQVRAVYALPEGSGIRFLTIGNFAITPEFF